jgi:hypothetical protein
MTAQIYLALFCQFAVTCSFASDVPIADAPTCSSHGDAGCVSDKIGVHDDAQVLLQSQKQIEILEHSKQQADPEERFQFAVRPADFENSMTMGAVVKVDDEIRGDGDLVAFVGDKVQGVQNIKDVLTCPFGFYKGKKIYHLMIYGHGTDEHKELTFKWLGRDGTLIELDAPTPGSKTFVTDATLGQGVCLGPQHAVVLTPVAGHGDLALLQKPGPEQKLGFHVNPARFEESMTVTAQVKIDGKLRDDGDLAAYVGDKLQGVTGILAGLPPWAGKVPPGKSWNEALVYGLMIYGHGDTGGTTPDKGKELTFNWLSHDGKLIKLESVTAPMAKTFTKDDTLGNAMEPVVLTPVAGAAPAPEEVCADAPQDEFDAYMEETFNVKNVWGFTCANFKSWGQCGHVAGECDKTCAVCS